MKVTCPFPLISSVQCEFIFGHMTTAGDMREEDMVVLLSERAAKEIYKKWLDTLNVSAEFKLHLRSGITVAHWSE